MPQTMNKQCLFINNYSSAYRMTDKSIDREVGIESAKADNKTPLIGVMCIDMAQSLEKLFGAGTYHSYLPASYVKQLEAAGAAVIPIWIGRDFEYYENIMRKVDGILLPGGGVFVNAEDIKTNPKLSNDCVPSARHIYELALKMNKAGQVLPVWGTCLGFQLLMINAAGDDKVRTDCQPLSQAFPIQLKKDYNNSKLFKELKAEMAEQMMTKSFACHHHRYCIPEENLRIFKLHEDWKVLATRKDTSDSDSDNVNDKLSFITLIEHKRFPIFGSQFHPEKVAYELASLSEECSESDRGVCCQLAQYFADTFVAACRSSNSNKFPDEQQKQLHLISNWQPQPTSNNWMECYVFTKDVDYPKAATIVNF